jgi:hypothetical protein
MRPLRALALGVVGLAVAAAAWSWPRTHRAMLARETCEAVTSPARAVEVSAPLLLADPGEADVRLGLECRAAALHRLGRGAKAATELRPAFLAVPAWAPAPDVAIPLIEAWAAAGDAGLAGDVASRSARAFPADNALPDAEWSLRTRSEDEATVLGDMEGRLSGPVVSPVLRQIVASAWLARGQGARARAALGETAPSGRDSVARGWWYLRMQALAEEGDVAAMQAHRDAMGLAWSPELAALLYAAEMTGKNLSEPGRDILTVLREALAGEAGVDDPDLVAYGWSRAILTLGALGRTEEALASWQQVSARMPLPAVDADELSRLVEAPDTREVRFDLPTGLALSVAPEGEPDAAWVPAGPRVRRPASPTPLRWVARDGEGQVRASGSAWPGPRPVVVTGREAVASGTWTPARRPADGRRRVWVMVVDCLDWRILAYLLERGELPVTRSLLGRGWRAVLGQEPALTASAMEALVHPERAPAPSFFRTVLAYGVEAQAFTDEGRNPFAALHAFVPTRPDLFETVGSTQLVAANLLFAYGNIDAGMNAQLVGPAGRHASLPLAQTRRRPTVAELARYPSFHTLQERAWAPPELQTLLAHLDLAAELVGNRDLDLLLLRTPSTDIFTHGYFGATATGAQDDGQGVLYDVYRLLDVHLGELDRALDEDDVLVLMSDHGIRTTMQHDPAAVFVAVGAGVPHGRAEGRPALLGVARALASLLGLATDWPDTGVAPW